MQILYEDQHRIQIQLDAVQSRARQTKSIVIEKARLLKNWILLRWPDHNPIFEIHVNFLREANKHQLLSNLKKVLREFAGWCQSIRIIESNIRLYRQHYSTGERLITLVGSILIDQQHSSHSESCSPERNVELRNILTKSKVMR